MSEHALQVKVLHHFEMRKAHRDALAFAIPNAARRSLQLGALLKAEGLTAGVPDLCILLPGGSTAWLELKAGKGRQTLAQKGFQARSLRLGHAYGMARSFDEAIAFLQQVGALR